MKTLCLEGSPISVSSLINHSHAVPRKSNYLRSNALHLSSKWKTAVDETNHDLSLELAGCWACLLQRGDHCSLCSFHSSVVKWGTNTEVQDMVTPPQSRILFLPFLHGKIWNHPCGKDCFGGEGLLMLPLPSHYILLSPFHFLRLLIDYIRLLRVYISMLMQFMCVIM